jgi:beta-N-acetylhexosaminidase
MTSLGPPPPGLEIVAHLTLPQLCGQLLVVGLSGPELLPATEQSLRAGLRGGVILFRRNLPSVADAWNLCHAVLRASHPELPPLIAVDEEGGRVRRLPPPFVGLPSMRELGRTLDPNLAFRAGAFVGRQLCGIGVSCDFAPVLDVDSNPDNPVIGDRSFGSDPRLVAHLGIAFGHGLEDQGVMACVKHFPGHGDTELDSHLALPRVNHGRPRLYDVELLPFREAAATSLSAMMTAHVVYPALDPSLTPATLSLPILTGIARNEFHFEGVIFSDDLEMRALADSMRLEQAAVGAIRAGCDALLICNRPELAERALDALVAAAEEEPEMSARVIESAIRMLTARRRFPPRPSLTLEPLLQMLSHQTGGDDLLAEIAAAARP